MATEDPTETWRPVPGYVERYEVSDLGRVRSLRLRTRGGDKARAVPLVLSPMVHPKSRHMKCRLYAGPGEWTDFEVSALVLMAFVGPRPGDLFACHREDDPSNNRLGNLRWDTSAGNYADAVRNGTTALGSRKGEDHGMARLTEDDVRAIRAACAAGEKQRAVAARFGVTQALVSLIHRRESWSHLA